jgi:hypothetical protein
MLDTVTGYDFWQWFFSGTPLPHGGLVALICLGGIVIAGLWPESKSNRSR